MTVPIDVPCVSAQSDNSVLNIVKDYIFNHGSVASQKPEHTQLMCAWSAWSIPQICHSTLVPNEWKAGLERYCLSNGRHRTHQNDCDSSSSTLIYFCGPTLAFIVEMLRRRSKHCALVQMLPFFKWKNIISCPKLLLDKGVSGTLPFDMETVTLATNK